jgi:hypothetical protein
MHCASYDLINWAAASKPMKAPVSTEPYGCHQPRWRVSRATAMRSSSSAVPTWYSASMSRTSRGLAPVCPVSRREIFEAEQSSRRATWSIVRPAVSR